MEIQIFSKLVKQKKKQVKQKECPMPGGIHDYNEHCFESLSILAICRKMSIDLLIHSMYGHQCVSFTRVHMLNN